MADETGGTEPRRRVVAVRPARDEVDAHDDADVAVPRRQIKTGPLHLRTIEELEEQPGLETRLPLLILLGLGVLVAVQVFLTL